MKKIAIAILAFCALGFLVLNLSKNDETEVQSEDGIIIEENSEINDQDESELEIPEAQDSEVEASPEVEGTEVETTPESNQEETLEAPVNEIKE